MVTLVSGPLFLICTPNSMVPGRTAQRESKWKQFRWNLLVTISSPRDKARVTDRLQRCNQSLPVGASEHHRVTTDREVPCDLLCFLQPGSAKLWETTCKTSQSSFSPWVHHWFLGMQYTGMDKLAVSTAMVHLARRFFCLNLPQCQQDKI